MSRFQLKITESVCWKLTSKSKNCKIKLRILLSLLKIKEKKILLLAKFSAKNKYLRFFLEFSKKQLNIFFLIYSFFLLISGTGEVLFGGKRVPWAMARFVKVMLRKLGKKLWKNRIMIVNRFHGVNFFRSYLHINIYMLIRVREMRTGDLSRIVKKFEWARKKMWGCTRSCRQDPGFLARFLLDWWLDK